MPMTFQQKVLFRGAAFRTDRLWSLLRHCPAELHHRQNMPKLSGQEPTKATEAQPGWLFGALKS